MLLDNGALAQEIQHLLIDDFCQTENCILCDQLQHKLSLFLVSTLKVSHIARQILQVRRFC